MEDLIETLQDIAEACQWALACQWSAEELQRKVREIDGLTKLAIDEALDQSLLRS
jgi:hypothetical protein